MIYVYRNGALVPKDTVLGDRSTGITNGPYVISDEMRL